MSFLCGLYSNGAVECAEAKAPIEHGILSDDDEADDGESWSGSIALTDGPSHVLSLPSPRRRRQSSGVINVDLTPRAEAASPLLQWRDVVVDFGGGVRAVDGASGSLRSGQFVSILGPSGAGKSTLLDVLTGRLAATAGDLLVLGRAHSAAAFRSVASFVAQDDCFLPHLRTWEALYFVARLRLAGRGPGEVLAASEELLKSLGLAEKRRVFVGGTLSGGVVVRGLSGG